MQENKKTDLKSLRELLNKPDSRATKKLYMNIGVKAFIEYFKALTNRREYYDEVFAKLVELSSEIFDHSTEDRIRDKLTMSGLLFAAEQLLNRGEGNVYKTLYIIEKALVEPIAICEKVQIQQQENQDQERMIF